MTDDQIKEANDSQNVRRLSRYWEIADSVEENRALADQLFCGSTNLIEGEE